MPIHRLETHVHTNVVSPCSRLAPQEIVRGYLRAGYSGIIVTDHLIATLPIFRGVPSWRERVHRFFSGYRAVRGAAAGTRLAVLPGFELTYPDVRGRDFLVYGIPEETLADMPDVSALDPERFKPLATAAGALVFQAHPFRNGRPVNPALVDGVEVLNAHPRHDSRNELAAAFAEEHALLTIGGSDAHEVDDIGRSGLLLPELPETVGDLVRWYKDASRDGHSSQPAGSEILQVGSLVQ